MDRVKVGGYAISLVLLALGTFVLLQGLGYMPGGFQGEGRWTGLGVAVALAGLAAAVISYRMRR